MDRLIDLLLALLSSAAARPVARVPRSYRYVRAA